MTSLLQGNQAMTSLQTGNKTLGRVCTCVKFSSCAVLMSIIPILCWMPCSMLMMKSIGYVDKVIVVLVVESS